MLFGDIIIKMLGNLAKSIPFIEYIEVTLTLSETDHLSLKLSSWVILPICIRK